MLLSSDHEVHYEEPAGVPALVERGLIVKVRYGDWIHLEPTELGRIAMGLVRGGWV